MKKDDDDVKAIKNQVAEPVKPLANSKATVFNSQSNGKANKENGGVGKMITNMMTNASAACYIGQNGLYQSNGNKATKGSTKSNGFSDQQLNGYGKSVDKKDM